MTAWDGTFTQKIHELTHDDGVAFAFDVPVEMIPMRSIETRRKHVVKELFSGDGADQVSQAHGFVGHFVHDRVWAADGLTNAGLEVPLHAQAASVLQRKAYDVSGETVVVLALHVFAQLGLGAIEVAHAHGGHVMFRKQTAEVVQGQCKTTVEQAPFATLGRDDHAHAIEFFG